MKDLSKIDLIQNTLRISASIKQQLADGDAPNEILEMSTALVRCFREGHKALICGNGGSAADAQHIAAEMVGRFTNDEITLPMIALTTDTSILSAIGNDFGFDHVFSRQTKALGEAGDLLFVISTSGNSKNLIEAVKVAKSKNMKSIGLLGGDGGDLKDMLEVSVTVPANGSARVQEAHIALGHILCELVELELG